MDGGFSGATGGDSSNREPDRSHPETDPSRSTRSALPSAQTGRADLDGRSICVGVHDIVRRRGLGRNRPNGLAQR